MPTPARSARMSVLWIFAILAVACGPGVAPPPSTPNLPMPEVLPSASADREGLIPPPIITVPLPGEPSAAVLEFAKLSPESCEDAERRAKDTRVREVRVQFAAAEQKWIYAHENCLAHSPPGGRRCTADDRGYRCREPSGDIRTYCWDSKDDWDSCDSYGTGGLGLFGEGEGAGGVGPGVVLGEKPGQGGRGGPREFTRTNTQLAAVDEPDLVKTDGRHVFVLSDGGLTIVDALRPKVVSVIRLLGAGRDLFVHGDRVVVFLASHQAKAPCTYGYDCQFTGDGTSTSVLVFDVRDRAKPSRVRSIELSGSRLAARRIGNAIHTVVYDGETKRPSYADIPDGLEFCRTPSADARILFRRHLESVEAKVRAEPPTGATIRDNGHSLQSCHSLWKSPSSSVSDRISLVSFDLTDDRLPPHTTSIQSRPGAIFASADALYVAVREAGGAKARYYSSENVSEVSHIHKFRIGANPRATKYVGSGIVPGHVLNPFSMDEWYGYLRVATSIGRVPDPGAKSVVSVLASGPKDSLVRVGAVDNIAPGEDIRAVRFDGDRGYVVTFKKTDPLFVVDLIRPDAPSIVGELKVPGFSTYIHRMDRHHLLSIGFDTIETSGGPALFQGLLLQLFDVSDPRRPTLRHRHVIGGRGSSSAAATNHLAFNFVSNQDLLLLPLTECGVEGVDGKGSLEPRVKFDGLALFKADREQGFRRLGGIDHGRGSSKCDAWWSMADSTVVRSVIAGGHLFSIARDKAKVQKLDAIGHDVTDIHLPRHERETKSGLPRPAGDRIR